MFACRLRKFAKNLKFELNELQKYQMLVFRSIISSYQNELVSL